MYVVAYDNNTYKVLLSKINNFHTILSLNVLYVFIEIIFILFPKCPSSFFLTFMKYLKNFYLIFLNFCS